MSVDLHAALKTGFGFPGFRPGQAEAITSLLDGKHTLVVMPTGAGKSLIYQLAALQNTGTTVVISPLIALMQDQIVGLERHRIPATFINSSIEGPEQTRRLQGLSAGEYRLVYVAPERLRNRPFLDALSRVSVSLLAVDEAHCISQWGHDFRPDYLRIGAARARMGNPITAALTATATPRVQDDIVGLLSIPSAARIITGFNRPNLFFQVRYAPDVPSKFEVLKGLLTEQDGGAAIVYVGTRRDAEEVAEFVRTIAQVNADHYHGGLDAETRTRVVNEFLAGDLPVVVATNAFGMGIDRADVQLVVHHAIPGTLESYYQEAGRGGRDGDPAQAVLIYSPQDRALQEWFIRSDTTTMDDLRELYRALPSRGQPEAWATCDDLSIATGFHQVKVKLCLAQLETGGAIERLGDDGPRMLIRLAAWDDAAMGRSADDVESRRKLRLNQLNQMIAYAESNSCRRRILLAHFGDESSADAPDCCDNCRPVESAAGGGPPDESGRVALVILDTLRTLKWEVGQGKLAKLLKGSQAKELQQLGYNQHPSYGKLAHVSVDGIRDLIRQLIVGGYVKAVGGNLPVLRLTPKGESAVEAGSAIRLDMPPEMSARKKPASAVPDTVEMTARMLAQKLGPAEIARQRDLTEQTIYHHMAQLIGEGRLSLSRIIPTDVIVRVRSAIGLVGDVSPLSPIKALLPDSISYGQISCVVEAWKLKKGIQPPRPKEPSRQSDDEVAAFLSRPHAKPLSGPWHSGWALDFHSRFDGNEWSRGLVGELAYRLKYEGDPSAVQPLVAHIMDLIAQHPELADIDGIVLMPPSMVRPFDPVKAVADELGSRLSKKVGSVLVRVRQTAPQKEMHSMAQKRANVAGAFVVRAKISGRKVLLLDDLYDSGMTLEEASRTLSRAGAARVCVLTLTRTIHSDA